MTGLSHWSDEPLERFRLKYLHSIEFGGAGIPQQRTQKSTAHAENGRSNSQPEAIFELSLISVCHSVCRDSLRGAKKYRRGR
jgi:hypothetical protein